MHTTASKLDGQCNPTSLSCNAKANSVDCKQQRCQDKSRLLRNQVSTIPKKIKRHKQCSVMSISVGPFCKKAAVRSCRSASIPRHACAQVAKSLTLQGRLEVAMALRSLRAGLLQTAASPLTPIRPTQSWAVYTVHGCVPPHHPPLAARPCVALRCGLQDSLLLHTATPFGTITTGTALDCVGLDTALGCVGLIQL